MIIGFTGTRAGMTNAQKDQLARLLSDFSAKEALHGDCVGADAEFHEIAKRLSLDITIYPPTKSDLRAFCSGAVFIKGPKSYFARNRDIVQDAQVLIGAPRTMQEESGGTWYTINYAKKIYRPFVVVWPDGTVLNQAHEVQRKLF